MDNPLSPPKTRLVEDSVRSQSMPKLSASGGILFIPTDARSQPPEEPYLSLFTQIAALQANEDYYGIIQAAECADLVAASDDRPTQLLVTMSLVLSYLIVDDLSSAKFALMRLPNSVASLPLSQATLNLFASVWERRYEHVYSRGETLLNLAQQADFLCADVPRVIASLVTAFIESFRKRTLALMSKGYTTIPLNLAQGYLGLSGDDLLSIASAQAWRFDASTHILAPASVSRETWASQSARFSPTLRSIVDGRF
ncbi:COP9 signalosome [Multifurca ochricompacta]|uniref:COP9 signalosome n=1 Tax=Multifurca ochricompacta TaxID=376703 RepID=A0AAD4QPV2_9AGAM|nr:COP9 signalosome [Multifurca ochricompacta]